MAKAASQQSLDKWTKEEWTTSDGKPSNGRKRYLPRRAWKALTPSQKRATNAAKARGNKLGRQFVPQPEEVAKKAARFR
jgi:hypothetical protein